MENFKKQRGAVAVMTAILLPVILTFTGIAIDVGRLYVEKTKLQNLADAAATSALVELKKTNNYREGSGRLTPTMPIGALSNNTNSPETLQVENAIKRNGTIAANTYLSKNVNLGSFSIPVPDESGYTDTTSSTGDYGAEATVYALKNSSLDDENIEYRYYYEVILSKRFPVYFARFVHPDDVLVRAGAVAVIDIDEPDNTPSYAYALANWNKLDRWNLQYNISSAKRLNADLEALRNIANFFLGQDASLMAQYDPDYNITGNGKKEVYLGNYIEDTNNIGTINSSFGINDSNKDVTYAHGMDEVIHWMQGDYGNHTGNYDSKKDLDSSQRYFFSDFNLSNIDKIAITPTFKDGKISQVRVRICPNSAANGGSGPLDVTVK